MNRQSKKFKPGKLSQLIVPILLALLTLGLLAVMAAIILSAFRGIP